jgi:hypothetical protein
MSIDKKHRGRTVRTASGRFFDLSSIVGLSVRQPWASLLTIGFKKDEIRSWWSKFAGPVAIHSSCRFPAYERGICLREPVCSKLIEAGLLDADVRTARHPDFSRLPFGAILGVALFEPCLEVDLHPQTALLERQLGEDVKGQFSFPVVDVVQLNRTISFKGKLGFWKVPSPLRRQIAALVV